MVYSSIEVHLFLCHQCRALLLEVFDTQASLLHEYSAQTDESTEET